MDFYKIEEQIGIYKDKSRNAMHMATKKHAFEHFALI